MSDKNVLNAINKSTDLPFSEHSEDKMPEVKSVFREVLPKQGLYHSSCLDSSSHKQKIVCGARYNM